MQNPDNVHHKHETANPKKPNLKLRTPKTTNSEKHEPRNPETLQRETPNTKP